MDFIEQALRAVNETARIDFKRDFDPNLKREWVEIIKDIVAMANSGGGIIIFGVDNHGNNVVDFDADAVAGIDPADVTNKINKYTGYQFGDFQIIKRERVGKEIVLFVIGKTDIPMVFSSPGTYSVENGKQKTAFSRGTIYFRHGTKSEPATREDLQKWAQNIRRSTTNELLEHIKTVATLPEGARLQIVSGAGEIVDTPAKLLVSAVRRREQYASHLLTSQEILWIFQQRHQIEITEAGLHLLIGSGLRRSPTLYWWVQLAEREYSTDLVLFEVQSALDASDRDKSDAARNIVEMAAIYADDELLQKIVSHLRSSRYAHFRRVGDAFVSRDNILQKLQGRIFRARYDGTLLLDMLSSEVENIATDIASGMVVRPKPNPSDSRRLGDITRALWYMNSTHAQKLFEKCT